jgi:hypothetical protein
MSRNFYCRRRLSAAATGDLQLRAGEVELRRRSRVVDAELLNAEEVLSSGDLVGNGHRVCACQLLAVNAVVGTSSTHCSSPISPGQRRSQGRSP